MFIWSVSINTIGVGNVQRTRLPRISMSVLRGVQARVHKGEGNLYLLQL